MNEKKKLLLVNDYRSFLELFERMLTLLSSPVILDKAFNGEEALDKIRSGEHYDAILMNIAAHGCHYCYKRDQKVRC